MTNVQLYFTIGIPTFTVLVSLVVAILQSSHALNQLNGRFTTLEGSLNARFSGLEGRFNLLDQDMKTLVRASNDLDVRLARLEERLAH
jgi:hypothetical protein